jgi:ATP-dependent helicase/nuclease subunit A
MLVLLDGLREKFVRRLGPQCLDILYEFLDVVMKYEAENSPSLQGFLEWFEAFDGKLKRESYAEENCVRLMTVHSSKGLQSPFAILADAHFYKNPDDKILKTKDGILLWDFSSKMRPKIMESLWNERMQFATMESWRLLYVALTRAEDSVCILGEKRKSGCRYSAIFRNWCCQNSPSDPRVQ